MNQHSQKKTPEKMVEAIFALDLDPIKLKLMDKKEGHGWTRAEADRHELDYKRFLALLAKFPDQVIAPNTDVDKFWHGHILDTMKYAEDCQHVFGYFLHHFPYFGMRGEEDAANLADAAHNMQRLYQQEFGAAHDATAAYCGAAIEVAYCGAAAGKEAAYCGAAQNSYCGAAVQVDAQSSSEQTSSAYCGVAVDKGRPTLDSAYCGAAVSARSAGQAVGAAYCGAAVKQQDAAYCGAAVGTAQPKPEQDSAYCGASAGKACSESGASSAYCGVAASSYCGAAGKQASAYCGAVAGPGRPTLEPVACS